jgi:hypothetical protein
MKDEKITFDGLKLPLLAAAIVSALFSLSGCGLFYYVKPEGAPSNAEITAGYYGISLKVSTAADAVDEIILPEYELLSQTKLIVAASGEKKSGYKSWLKVAAFDENEKTARRKYLVIEDEMPKTLFARPRASAYIEYQMVIDKDLQNASYTNQSAKLMAILKDLQKKAGKDIAEVSANNKSARLCGGILNQSLYIAAMHLENSQAEIDKLNTTGGVSFSHPSYDKGTIWMGIDYDVATVQIKVGSLTKKWRLSFEKNIENEGVVW